MDRITQQRLALLHPALRDEATQIIAACNAQLTGCAQVRVVQGLRTMAEQEALYAQGRSTPGAIVTNAPAGYSYHNYGLAIDFALLIDGKEISWNRQADFDNDKTADWWEVVKKFKKHGWAWGGEFKSIKDFPHVEKTFGFTIAELKMRWDNGDIINNYVNLNH
jgi:peptidoglycan L-alanyl-D-glutamate endopeptidase CwlK